MGVMILILVLTGGRCFVICNLHSLGFVIILNFLSHPAYLYFSVIGFAFSFVFLARPWISGTGATSFLDPESNSGRFIPFFANDITSEIGFHRSQNLLPEPLPPQKLLQKWASC